MAMKKWILLALIFSFIYSTAQERELVLWNKNEVSVSPWEKVSLEVAEKIHYSTERNSADLKYAEIFFEYEVKNWLELSLGFRNSKLNLQNGDWLNENRPMVVLNLSKEINKFELSFSNRLEYKCFKYITDYFRYRQALTFDFPTLTDWGMQFYVAEESFIKMNGGGTHLARLYTGLKAIDQKHFDMKLYYSLQKTKVLSQWLTADIVGINLSFCI